MRTLLLAILCLTAGRAEAAQPVEYRLDLTAPETHLVKVTLTVPRAGAGTEIQFPAWYGLYQIRDFVKDVEDLKGDCDGRPADLLREDLNTWRGPAQACANLVFHYSVYADTEGPFDSVLDSDHAFLNLAMILFYLPRERQRPVQAKFRLPAGWKFATFLADGEEYEAANYDALVDSPVECGHFAEFDYPQDFTPGGGTAAEARHAAIRVIIDADPADYSSDRILDFLRRITTEEIQLMQDLPFRRYTFLFHFLRGSGSTGGMEHRDGTAIALPAAEVRDNPSYLEDTAAHEFFHAWNVKRIRPQALEPIDYIKGNDTRDLWFCEGVTSTYAQLTLLRAGLIDRDTFYRRVAQSLETLQNHRARLIQSVETAGREAWLEKYADYNRSERSISYYNKGEILGYLLDLAIRHASRNQAGLDDVMRRLNLEFGQSGRFYTRADLGRIIQQLAPGFEVERFFTGYLTGTQELDYSRYLGYAGMQVVIRTSQLPVPGFSASPNAAGQLQVDSVDAGSAAEGAGLQLGDAVAKFDGKPLPVGSDARLPAWRPGETVKLQVVRSDGKHDLTFRIGMSPQTSVNVAEDPAAAGDQLRVRQGWLTGAQEKP